LSRIGRGSALALALAVGGCVGEDEASGPFIDDIQPAAAAPGETIEILGVRFCSDLEELVDDEGLCDPPVSGVVLFGEGVEAARAQITGYGQERITAIVPAAAVPGATIVTLSRDMVPSNPFDFEVQ
jgi:hypothetical protein